MTEIYNTLSGHIDERTATVCIIGLGYVGLPMLTRHRYSSQDVRHHVNEKRRCTDIETVSTGAIAQAGDSTVQGRPELHRYCKIVGVRRETAGKWWRLHQEGGATSLRAQKRGRSEGSGRTLLPDQETILISDITDRTQDQLKLSFALWTCRAVQEHIHRLWDFMMPIRTVSSYLQRWGFTTQNPLKRAYEQRSAEVTKWLESHKQEIELFSLPSHFPELNPDEHLNCDLKAGVHSSVPARDKKERKQLRSHMRMTLMVVQTITGAINHYQQMESQAIRNSNPNGLVWQHKLFQSE